MSQRRRICIALLILVAILGVVQQAAALNISGRSSTQYTWYNDPVDGSKQWDAAEYLRFSMTDIDSAKRLSVQGYGRIDYSSKVEEGEDKTDNRIYYLYADYRGLMDKVDLRIGRQFVNLSAGSGIIDGIQADVKQIGFVGVTVMGGRDIIFGERGNVTSHAAAGGMALYLAGIKNTDLDVSYYRAYDYSDISRETLGFNFKQYLLDSVKVYANARYDLTAEVFNEVLGGIKYFPKLDLMLTAEYYESYPTFDTTSIFSVFAVDKYKESVFRADYTALTWLDLSAGYTSQDFGEGGSGYVTEIGVRVRPSHRLTVGLFYDDTRGDGGNLNGWKTYAEYSDLKKINVAGGIDYDVYQRDNMTGSEIARKYWVATRYNFTKQMSTYLRVEDNVNVNYSKDMRGRLTFDVDF
jgi:hypothetical protein